MNTSPRPGDAGDSPQDDTARAFDEIISHWDEPLPDAAVIEQEVAAQRSQPTRSRIVMQRQENPEEPTLIERLARADAIMDADQDNDFVPPEPSIDVVKPRNTAAVAMMVMGLFAAAVFGFFIDSSESDALAVLGLTVFLSSLVYLVFKAAGREPDNHDGTV